MNTSGLPLLALFNRLRDHGFLLGVEEYQIVLRALQAGFGFDNRRDLALLCRLAWTKSADEEGVFQRFFDQFFLEPTQVEETIPESVPLLTMEGSGISDEIDEQEFTRFSDQPLLQKEYSSHYSVETKRAINLEEPIEVVQAVRRQIESRNPNMMIKNMTSKQLGSYFPITRRQMKQSWRHLRRPTREGPPTEMDVDATIEKIGRDGILLEPVLVPRRSNQADLLLLMDQDGSMTPFHILSRQLAESARNGGRLRKTGIFYFHDYPEEHLFADPERGEAWPIKQVLQSFGQRAFVFIVSDAGAARGRLDAERIANTQRFIQMLKQSVRRYVWLNPLPKQRWYNTTAIEISNFVPMFEMTRRGLDIAISVLRGYHVHPDSSYG